jgi:DNA adenine methylase
MDTNITRPFLKWVGGKTQIIGEVLAGFPADINNYHEPFLGGGSVLLGMLSLVRAGKIHVAGDIRASDLNPNLIALYTNIQQNPAELIRETNRLVEAFGAIAGTAVNRKASTEDEASTSQESYYFWIRARFNALYGAERTSPLASAMMLFLNKTCFRGVYREGPRGFNVPFGNYKNPAVIEDAHIWAVSDLVKDVKFAVAPYSEALARAAPGDFVYLDPPYAPESDKSFVGYTSDGFGAESHADLFGKCRDLEAAGVRILMSNADVRLVRDAFPAERFAVKTISCRRSINSKRPGSKANEVLIASHTGQ